MVIGLTGNTGSGKTSAAKFFVNHGFRHVNCDDVAHDVLENDAECLLAVRETFRELGDAFSETSGRLVFNRRTAAAILFRDEELLRGYSTLVFRYICQKVKAEILAHPGENVLLDAPTLFESGADSLCDVTIAVISSEDNSFERITERDGIDGETANLRLHAGKNVRYYVEKADHLIENNGGFYEFEKKIEELITRLGLESG